MSSPHRSAHEDALSRLERTAQAFLDEASRLDAAASETATATNEGATVTVNARGQLVAVDFPPMPTTPERWNHFFGEAYTQALWERPDLVVPTEAPGPPGVRPSDRPRAPEQEVVAAQIRALQERELAEMTARNAVAQAEPPSFSASSGGVTITVNTLEVIIDATASTEALRDHSSLDDHVMAAYRAACARIDLPAT
ncbi:hypothetical protein ACSDQ9_01405 [Aestuariimicrobium soli]|uniref:hypothetical protein n=1 Tax=Aestuariimicrobium soli TaxID=2035834 RepID=UPI003EBFA55C